MPCVSNVEPRISSQGARSYELGIDNSSFYFCPYPPGLTAPARYDLLQSTVPARVPWFQPVARACCAVHTDWQNSFSATPGASATAAPFSVAAAHVSMAKTPPCYVAVEEEEEQERRGRGTSMLWPGVRNTADGGSQAACLFSVLDGRVSACTHIVTLVTRQRNSTPFLG